MPRTRRLVIVGGGLGGARCAEHVRHADADREIVLLADERFAPYDRPPLTKSYLREGGAAPLLNYDWTGLNIDLRLNAPAAGLDLAAESVRLESGARIGFDDLIIATGARPRKLPGLHGAGVHTVRSIGDADALRADLQRRRAVTIVGGGFIGCEIASSARAIDASVILLEALPAPLARVLGVEVGTFVADLHRRNGVDVRCGAAVTDVIGDEGTARELVLASGQRVPAGVVVVGLGVLPNTEWLAGCGLDIDDGVLCDAAGRTSRPHVYAVGDVARWQGRDGVAHRHEHWTRAGEQARVVADAILGKPGTLDEVPYVWSDQVGVTMQLLGAPSAADRVTVIAVTNGSGRGERPMVALYGRGGMLTAVFGIGCPRHVMRQRAAVAGGAQYEEAVAATTSAATR